MIYSASQVIFHAFSPESTIDSPIGIAIIPVMRSGPADPSIFVGPGLRRLRQRDRLRRRRRTGLSRSRLLHQDRRQIPGDAAEVCGARGENVRAAGRCRRLQREADAQTVMDIETALAKASLTRVEKRDPYKLFHKMTPAQLQALTPVVHWDAITSRTPSGCAATSRSSTSPSRRSTRSWRAAEIAQLWTTGRRICAGTWSTPRRAIFLRRS